MGQEINRLLLLINRNVSEWRNKFRELEFPCTIPCIINESLFDANWFIANHAPGVAGQHVGFIFPFNGVVTSFTFYLRDAMHGDDTCKLHVTNETAGTNGLVLYNLSVNGTRFATSTAGPVSFSAHDRLWVAMQRVAGNNPGLSLGFGSLLIKRY
jgi:hypothetical protein